MSTAYRKITYIFFSLLVSAGSYAQFINMGQDRPSQHWKQINTADFQIIYPDFFEKNAQKLANIYARLYRQADSLCWKTRKISVIVRADGGISNGNVTLAPRKSELYTAPPQNPSDNWLEHLCIHEFRHVMQLDKVNQGLTKGLSRLFGELAPVTVSGAYVPMWLMEGDAVCFESSAGRMGRGRSPEFIDEMKAQVVEKGIYSYSKAVLGSYKDHVPNRYNMGYFMTANSRVHYGTDLWAKALERTGRHPFGIAPFNKSLKLSMAGKRDSLWRDSAFRSLFGNADSTKRANTLGNAKRTLYRDNFSELRQIWKREAETVHPSFDTIRTRNRYYTDYYYPHPQADGSIIAYKKGLQETGAFVRLKDGKEKNIVRTGSLPDYKFAVGNNRIVWSEYRPHPRWEQGGRMRLSSYDLESGKYRRYRGRHNQFSPFPVENNWGVVETDPQNRVALVILDSTLNHEIWRLPARKDELFIHPTYRQGKIVTVVQSPEGIRLESIDLKEKQRRRLTADVYYELDNPIFIDSTILYRASYQGNNAFYRLDGENPRHLINGRYGLRFPAYCTEDRQLYFSFYTSDGYKPGKTACTQLEGKPVEYAGFQLADSIRLQENGPLPSSRDSIYPTRKYRSLSHAVNMHSWGPLYIDLNGQDVDFGAVVYSQNKLNTLSFTAGYVLKSGYSHGTWLFNATYSRWWPVLSLEVENGKDDSPVFTQGTNLQTDSTEQLYLHNKFRHSVTELTVQFPFNLSARQYNRSLRPYFRYKIEGIHRQHPGQTYTYSVKDNVVWLSPVEKSLYRIFLPSRYYQLLEYGLIFSNQTHRTEQEIQPRWGQRFTAGYTHALNHGLALGHQWWGESRLYFPGLAVNHSLSLYGGFQHMSGRNRNYDNKILYPRGITLPGYEISSLRCSYHLPLFYPDRQLGALLYFKSIDGGLFYDTGNSRSKNGTSSYSSYGVELTTDTHFLRLTIPVHMGIRAGYETQTKKMFADLIFSIGMSI